MNERRFKYDPASVNDAIDIRRLADSMGAKFFPAGGQKFVTRCVFADHEDRTPSFFIWTDTNHFYCFGCRRGGDPLKLIEHFHGWTGRGDFSRVIEEGARFGNVRSDLDDATIEKARRIQAQKRRTHEARLEADRRAKMENARKRWFDAEPLTPAHIACTYLQERRGIDMAALAHWPQALRFDPAKAWNMAGKDEPPDWQHFPAILSAMTRGREGVSAVHTTFLLPDGSDVARHVAQKGRIVSGSVAGAAIRLSHGKSGLKPKPAYEKYGMDDTLCLCEGIEDALSLALLRPDWRVWAAYSRDNIGKVIPPECAGEVVIAAENDQGAAHDAAWEKVKACQLRLGQGRKVSIARPPQGLKDWNAIHERMPG